MPKSTALVGELVAREAEVEERAVDGTEPSLGGDGRQVAEVRLPDDQAVAEAWPESVGHSGDGRPIGIKTEEAAIRVGRLQDPLGVPTAAQGGIDLKASGSRLEHLNDLLRQHRCVPCLHLSSIQNDRIPSGPWKRMWWR